jgi:hypothetical protein
MYEHASASRRWLDLPSHVPFQWNHADSELLHIDRQPRRQYFSLLVLDERCEGNLKGNLRYV